MARRFEGLTRALGGISLASVAYGEIGSSLYFALGIVALYALGLTPLVLLAAGVVFLLVAVSYAEGTAAIPEPGGAALFVRRAFNDPAGFATGWVLLLDYLIVSALAAIFVPHYLARSAWSSSGTRRGTSSSEWRWSSRCRPSGSSAGRSSTGWPSSSRSLPWSRTCS